MSDEQPQESGDDEVIDFDARELCPDGSCTGVLDAEGRCKVCGLSADGSKVPRSPDDEADGDDGEPAEAAGDDDDRKLCPDGACIGLIGPDGKCKVCGLAEDASPPNAD